MPSGRAGLPPECKDVSELLAELCPLAPRQALPLRVAVQDSCHLQHAQGIRNAPRQLLSAIPELEVVEVAEAALCCGSAGIYNLVEPTPANELGDRKARQILDTGADVFVSGNPGCLLHLQASMRRLGREVPALHTIELIDASIRGVMPIRQPRKALEDKAA